MLHSLIQSHLSLVLHIFHHRLDFNEEMMQCTQGDEDHRNGLIDVSNAMSDCKCGLLGKDWVSVGEVTDQGWYMLKNREW